MPILDAHAYIDGEPMPTKGELRKALSRSPEKVLFGSVSSRPTLAETWSGKDLPDDVVLSVTGCSPRTHQDWYALVTRKASGKLEVT